jgi:hypothetical protein
MLQTLEADALCQVLSRLPGVALARLASTCTFLRLALEDESVWHEMLKRSFGAVDEIDSEAVFAIKGVREAVRVSSDLQEGAGQGAGACSKLLFARLFARHVPGAEVYQPPIFQMGLSEAGCARCRGSLCAGRGGADGCICSCVAARSARLPLTLFSFSTARSGDCRWVGGRGGMARGSLSLCASRPYLMCVCVCLPSAGFVS